VKFDGVEIYTNARFFTFTGRATGEIKAAATELRALVKEVRTKEAAAKQQQELGRSDSGGVSGWFEILPPQLKDEVVDHALGVIAKDTPLLELEADGGNNAEYYKLTVSVARSSAPHAEDIFVKYASTAKNADTDEALRQHFSRCQANPPSDTHAITVGTLLHLAQQHGANFDRWKRQASPITWSAADLQVSFSNIPHRQWLYSTYLIRGEITVLAAPGGAGKTALANGIAIEIATGTEKLGEKVWRNDDQKVLYVNGEDSSTEMQRRLCAFCQQHKLSEQDLVRLYLAGADDTRVQSLSFLWVNDKGATALNEAGFNVLESALQSLRPDLLVLDPLVVFCGGGNMNDNAVMSLVMRKLKALAVKYDCAILVVHHTRKGRSSDATGDAESVSGAAAIVNLARRALMPVTMTETEADFYGVLPSQRLQYCKLVDAKSNMAPLSAESPWYELASEELPNPEPPIYPNGDRVQAVKRAYLDRSKASYFEGPEQLTIRFELMKLVDRGLTIDGEKVPYSPNSTGNNQKRAILEDAMKAVEKATQGKEWRRRDLRSVVTLKHEGWVVVEKIAKGRFRRTYSLRPVWERTPWKKERENLSQHGGPTVRTEQEQQELERVEMKNLEDRLLTMGNRQARPKGQLVNDPVND
jgi:hypothetical protein